MATQYGINNAVTMVVQPHHHQQFVSSSVYYGYVPMRLQDEADHQAGGMDVDADRRAADLQNQQQQQHQHHLLGNVESPRCLVQRKRAIGHEELAACVPRLKRFREEAVVTNVFSMVQGTASGQKNVDWPRCTMNRHYYV